MNNFDDLYKGIDLLIQSNQYSSYGLGVLKNRLKKNVNRLINIKKYYNSIDIEKNYDILDKDCEATDTEIDTEYVSNYLKNISPENITLEHIQNIDCLVMNALQQNIIVKQTALAFQDIRAINSISSVMYLLNKLEEIFEKIKNIHGTSDEKLDSINQMTFPQMFWFRGSSDSNYTLTPSIFRPILNNKNRYYNEYTLFKQFKAKYKHTQPYEMSDLDYLTSMQHYGFPTRLLDWSENILYALYFAVKDNDTKDGKLTILNPKLLNGISIPFQLAYADFIYDNDKILSERIKHYLHIDEFRKLPEVKGEFSKYLLGCFHSAIAIVPNQSNERIRRQAGMFTYHGGYIPSNNMDNILKTYYFNGFTIEELNKYHNNSNSFKVCYDILIKKEDKEKLRKELFSIGVHKGALFPELQEQSDYLKSCFQ